MLTVSRDLLVRGGFFCLSVEADNGLPAPGFHACALISSYSGLIQSTVVWDCSSLSEIDGRSLGHAISSI